MSPTNNTVRDVVVVVVVATSGIATGSNVLDTEGANAVDTSTGVIGLKIKKSATTPIVPASPAPTGIKTFQRMTMRV